MFSMEEIRTLALDELASLIAENARFCGACNAIDEETAREDVRKGIRMLLLETMRREAKP